MIEKIRDDLKNAMKNGEKNKINALRNLMNRLKSQEIDTGSKLTSEEALKICFGAAKQIKDSINQFQQADRKDLVEKEKIELNIIETYLPKQMTEEEILKIIKDVIKKTGANSPSDMGKVMGPVIKAVEGKADGKIIQSIVIKELNS